VTPRSPRNRLRQLLKQFLPYRWEDNRHYQLCPSASLGRAQGQDGFDGLFLASRIKLHVFGYTASSVVEVHPPQQAEHDSLSTGSSTYRLIMRTVLDEVGMGNFSGLAWGGPGSELHPGGG
jgi:hypothetical protein